MTGRAPPPVEHGTDPAPPLRRAPLAGDGGPIANGAELLEACMRAIRIAGFKTIEDLLADKPNTGHVRIREELANVCQAVGLNMEAYAEAHAETRADFEHLLRQWGAIVTASGIEPRMEDADSSIMTAALCERVRHKPTNLERVAVSAARSDEPFAEAFAKAAKETPT